MDKHHPGGFPDTATSAIAAAASADRTVRAAGFETIAAAYWNPIYKYLRFKWNKDVEDARDLTQGFFAEAIDKGFFNRYDPAKGRFRTFLRVCLDGFIANHDKAATRLKRGGTITFESLGFQDAESEFLALPPDGRSPEDYFDREWIRAMFARALETLRSDFAAAGKPIQFALFERYINVENDSNVSHKHLAIEFGLSPTTVNNHLSAARRRYRTILLDQLRQITMTEEEFLREARILFGDV